MTRRSVVLACLVAAALLGLSGSLPWATGAADGVLGARTVTASGFAAVPALGLLAAAAAMTGVLLMLAGRRLTRLLALVPALVVPAGVVLMLTADAHAALQSAAADAVGVPEVTAVEQAVGGRIVLVAALLACAVVAWWVWCDGPQWPVVGRRFERTAGPAANTDGAAAGEGSVAGAAREAGRAEAGGNGTSDGAGTSESSGAAAPGRRSAAAPTAQQSARVQAIDDWEAIERGEDPTV